MCVGVLAPAKRGQNTRWARPPISPKKTDHRREKKCGELFRAATWAARRVRDGGMVNVCLLGRLDLYFSYPHT